MQKEALSVQLLSSRNAVQYGKRYVLARQYLCNFNVFKCAKDLSKNGEDKL
jgi:hypothetical protein